MYCSPTETAESLLPKAREQGGDFFGNFFCKIHLFLIPVIPKRGDFDPVFALWSGNNQSLEPIIRENDALLVQGARVTAKSVKPLIQGKYQIVESHEPSRMSNQLSRECPRWPP